MTYEYTSTPTGGRRGSIFLSKNALQNICLVAIVVATTVLILLRDAYSVSVNKYLLVALAALGAVCLSTEKYTYLMFFFLPLYFGLPGNYITMLFLGRMLLSYKFLKIDGRNLILCILISLFILIQNMVTGFGGFSNLMVLFALFVFMFLFSYRTEWNLSPMLLSYSFGVAMLGLIMLISTLQVYEMEELMDNSLRLGDANYVADSAVMHVSVDPNYYGAYAISALAMGVPFLQRKGATFLTKLLLLISLLTATIVCFIGLSRSFVIVLIAWIAIYLLSQRKWKNLLIAAIILTVVAIVLLQVMPNVFDSLTARFNDSDMATANGRTNQIGKYYNAWLETFPSMLFGIGMYNCEIHCTPLQFLFGGGLVMFGLVIAYALTLKPHLVFHKKPFYETYLPIIATFVMMLTIPAAMLINSIFPLVITYFHSCCIKSRKDGI